MSQIAEVFANYKIEDHLLDEVFADEERVNPYYEDIYTHFSHLSPEDFKLLNEYAKLSFLNQGITYSVYSDNNKGTERIFPFDLFPRVIPADQWSHIEKGILQRNIAMNEFIKDIYSDQKILKDKIVPSELIFSSSNYCEEMVGVQPVGGIFCHICGTDIIRHSDGEYYVLEDNLRCPSGVSYVLSNRVAMKRTLAKIFQDCQVRTVAEYPVELLAMLQSVASEKIEFPTCVVLTPGIYNSAYYEHSFLAQSMGIELVEGSDLFVENNCVYMKTIFGPKKVDVIYRRIDDAFLDPLVFNPKSLLGVPGLVSAYRSGNVTLVNAPGTGVSDDKAVYSYVPEIIKYYLGEDAILKNVPTYLCERENERKYVLDNIPNLVVKPVDQSGGYGVTIGHTLSKAQIEELKEKIKENPREYIAQPIMRLTVHSTFIEDQEVFEPRHIDLRTFTLLGRNKNYVLQGGLSRVALRKGSLIVNSSQGGGSKDTWVVEN
ncbi:MAG: circularly permuted type 2 ATP-grasp protein [Microscillaceae bacterium]|nr:circularly permuted type 2 ATP-grasp protein [Microscillaceae bacterium]